jgi:DNA-directed RNA polymerase subunit M/transcription elongation factor TFIIS
MLRDRGLSAFEAFVWSARLKHENASAPKVVTSAKQLVSVTNHQWMDRVLRAAASLDVGGHPSMSDDTLCTLTNHHKLIEEASEDERRISELLSTAKKERASGFLVCRNCRSTHVDVDQMQTRSADEPMTLFALCLECGNRWTKK